MARDVELDELDVVLRELSYPIDRDAASEATADVTLVLAGGEENLGDLIAQSGDETFDSVTDLEEEIMNLLPQHAVGEPYQAEGEG